MYVMSLFINFMCELEQLQPGSQLGMLDMYFIKCVITTLVGVFAFIVFIMPPCSENLSIKHRYTGRFYDILIGSIYTFGINLRSNKKFKDLINLFI